MIEPIAPWRQRSAATPVSSASMRRASGRRRNTPAAGSRRR
ncbi:Uncharacterised protein [Bordetella pertussis]|nr:Uncharacterised protein [Bordetella pertussis]